MSRILETWRRYGERPTYTVELAKVLDSLKDLAAVLGAGPPRAKPNRLASLVDGWGSGLLEDEVWETSWIVNGEDLAAGMIVLPMGAGSAVGAVLGGFLLPYLPSSVLKLGLGAILIVSAVKLFRRRP